MTNKEREKITRHIKTNKYTDRFTDKQETERKSLI